MENTQQQVEDIKFLNIDNVQHEVEKMSGNVQGLVALYNNWNRKEFDAQKFLAEAQSNVIMIQAAKADLSRRIIEQVRIDAAAAEQAKAEVEENTEGPVEAENDGG